MAVIKTHLLCELNEAVKVQYLDGVLFSQDNQANQIVITVLDNGQPATLSGSVSANIIRSDGGTVAATGGTISGNVVSITLPAAAYAVPGVVSVAVKVTASGVVTTIAAFVATMYRSSTDTAVDPGTIIPSIQTLIAQINAAVASIPADYSALWTKLAPAFSDSASYVAGQYVTYNSGLYRFNKTHTGSWSSSDVTAVNLGGEISALKSAVENNIVGDNSTIKVNLLDYYPKYSGYLWNNSNPPALTANSALTACGPIPVKAGKTYYFRNVYGYGSTLYQNGSGSRLSDKTYWNNFSVITPSYDGLVYVSIWNDYTNPVVTDSIELFKLPDKVQSFTKIIEDNSLKSIITQTGLYHENIAEKLTRTVGKGYASSNLNITSNASVDIFAPFFVPANTKLYYKNLYGDATYIVNASTYGTEKLGTASDLSGVLEKTYDFYLYPESHTGLSVLITFDKLLYSRTSMGSFTELAVPVSRTDVNILDDCERKEFYVYNGSGNEEANAACALYTPINLTANKTYYFRNLWAYFCMINTNGTYTRLDPTNFYGYRSFGSFTPTNDCIIKISVSHEMGKCLFTESRELFDDFEFETQKVIKNVMVPNYTKQRTFYVGSGEEYTRIRDAVAEAVLHKGSKVIVRVGTYDLADEFADEIEADNNRQYGIYLDNDVHLFFEPGTLVTMLVPSGKEHTRECCSPFYTQQTCIGGFTLENLFLKTTNTRYCVHDDVGQIPENVARTVKYINCHMEYLTDDSIYARCIGGGNGCHDYIIIQNCYLYSANPDSASSAYHNNQWSADAQQCFVISNNYFAGENGHFRLSYIGPSQKISSTIYNNNSSGKDLLIKDDSTYDYDQFSDGIVSYNNEIRNA